MSQPTPYNRQASFSNIQAQSPADPLPGATVDAELNAVKVTLDQILANIELIQRDDGALANESVGYDQLSEELSAGINPWTVWVTSTAYAVGDTVFQTSAVYRCLVAHTSGTFSTDLAASKWVLIIDLAALTLAAASQISNTPAGTIAATTVQAAIDELASEKAATSHTHASSAISDSTAAGRDMLTAANVAAQQTLLGLGDLAYEDTVSIDQVEGNLAFTSIIEPAALNGDTNNWAPTGIATASTVRVSSSVAINLTGITAPAVDGTILFLENKGAFPITLVNNSTGSSTANRFIFLRSFVLRPQSGIILKYDGSSAPAHWHATDSFSEHPRGHIAGLALSNNVLDATNDIDIAEGEARDSTNAYTMIGTAMTKRLDAGWVAGTGNGMRNSAAVIDNTTYHIYLVGKLDGTTDYYAHTSTTVATVITALQAESGGTDYIYARRIGSIVRRSSAIQAFAQKGDDFIIAPTLDITNTSDHTTAQTAALASVPVGINVRVELNAHATGDASTRGVLISSLLISAPTVGTTAGSGLNNSGLTVGGNINSSRGSVSIWTNTSAQIRYQANDSSVDTYIWVLGWVDPRGKDS